MINAITLLFALLIVVTVSAKERIRGTKVSINAPVGFEQSIQFPGYLMKGNGSSLLVTPINGVPFATITKGFTKEKLKKRNVLLISQENPKFGEHQGQLLHTSLSSGGVDYLKWVLIIGDGSNSIILTATFSKAVEEEVSATLKASLLSAEWNPSLKLAPLDRLTFTISETDSMKIENKTGNTLILGENAEVGSATIVVKASVTENWPAPEDQQKFTEKHLKTLVEGKTYKSTEIAGGKKVTIDNLSGYFLHGSAIVPKTNETVYIELCILFEEDEYFIFHASVEQERKEEFKKEFAQVLNSFKKK